MADIVLKDRSGNPVEYPGVERIKVNTVDGEAVEFVDSAVIPEVVENYPVVPDFSNGNQILTAPDGYVVKSAIYQKPANLIPENIAEGVDIAGIIGALAAGAKVAVGTIEADTTSSVTVTHNLGVIPDLVLYVANSNTAPTANKARIMSLGASAGLREKFPLNCQSLMRDSSNVLSLSGYNSPITSTSPPINSATESTFILQAFASTWLRAGTWIAIAGLT